MANKFYVEIKMSMVVETDLSKEEFERQFDPEALKPVKPSFTLPDGSVHRTTLAAVEELEVSYYGEEENEDEEKATDGNQ